MKTYTDFLSRSNEPLLTLERDQMVRVSFLPSWALPNKGYLQGLRVDLDATDPWRVYLVKAVLCPTNDKGHLDRDRLLAGCGAVKAVWIPIAENRLWFWQGILQEFPAHEHDLLIHCTDEHYQHWSLVPCKDSLVTKVMRAPPDRGIELKRAIQALDRDQIQGQWVNLHKVVPLYEHIKAYISRTPGVNRISRCGCWPVHDFIWGQPTLGGFPVQEIPEWVTELTKLWTRWVGDHKTDSDSTYRPPWLTGVQPGGTDLRHYKGHWYLFLSDQADYLATDAPIESLLGLALDIGAGKVPMPHVAPEMAHPPKIDALVDALLED